MAIQNWFDFSLLRSAPADALIACRPEDGAHALVVIPQRDGGIDDSRLTGREDFFPIGMASEEGFSGYLEGGDWTVIPRVRQEAPDHDACYRDYVLVPENRPEAAPPKHDRDSQDEGALKCDRFQEALVLAAKLHAGQVRKGTTIPYIAHALAVAALTLEYGANEEEAVAALLHDAIEDCGGAITREVIRRRFGDAVVEIVDGCTDAETIPKPPWRERKEAYIAHVPRASHSVRLVSMADKLHNAQATLRDYRVHRERLWDRFRGGRDGTLWYYRALVNAFREAGTSSLLDELDQVVTALEGEVQKATQ